MSEYKHGSMNVETQEQAFAGFVTFVKWGVIVTIGILVFMALVNA